MTKPVIFKCPACREDFDPRIVTTRDREERSFACPFCQEKLQISPLYTKTIAGISLAISCLIAYRAGVDDPFGFVRAVILITFVVASLISTIVRRIVPPKIELYAPQFLSLNLSGRERQ